MANVREIIALPAGIIISRADHRYRNEGRSPKAFWWEEKDNQYIIASICAFFIKLVLKRIELILSELEKKSPYLPDVCVIPS